MSRDRLALDLPPARRAAHLPAVALAGGATLCLVHAARLAPGVDGAAVATALAAHHGWWLAALVAAVLPLTAVRAGAAGGTPHTGPLGRLHATPATVLPVTVTAGLLTLAAGLAPLLLTAAFGGYHLIGRGLAPGAACFVTVVAVAAAGGRLAPARQLLLHYALLVAVVVLLWRPFGW